MDISDHQLSSHGLPLMKLPSKFPSYNPGMPLDYVNNFHQLDYPNINHAAQLPSIPFIADFIPPSSLIHYANQPYLMFPSMNMSSISQLDLPRSCTTAFDYPFNQIYHDSLPSSIFNYGVDQQALPTCEANYYKGLTYPSNREELADPFPTTTAKPYTFSRQDEDATRRVNMEVKSEITMPNYGPSSLFSDVSIPLAPTFLHNLVDMESHHVKEDAYDSTASFNDLAASTSADCFDFPLPSLNSARENPISQSKRPLHAKESNSSNTEASCSHAGNVISTATACKTQAPKKRKSQQKRVVCVRATGGLDKPTGECLPSDSWAWRKYGQKAIKGSPYPRSYYRCSSLKGCTARKQVERNPSDPLMIIMTYTSDHNHSSAAGRQATKTDDDKGANAVGKYSNNRISGDVNDQISEESCEPNSSEDNNTNNNMSDTNMINTAHHHMLHVNESDDQEQGVSSTTVEESLAFKGLLLSSSNGNMQARSDRKLAEEDFFAQLDELPDWSGGINPLDARLDHINDDQEGINHGANSMDPFDLFDWS